MIIPNKNSNGFTLVEIIIVLGIFSMAILAINLFAINIFKMEIFFSDSLNSEIELQQSYKIMGPELRSIAVSSIGSYPISEASPSSFTFFSDIDNDGYTDRVRYFTENNILKKGVVKPSGVPLNYDLSSEKVTETVHYLTTNNIFSYFDSDYDGSQSPLGYPIDLSLIRMVKIQLAVDKDLNQLPGELILPIFVYIRNLRGI